MDGFRLGPLYIRGEPPGAHWIGCHAPRAGLGAREKFSAYAGNRNQFYMRPVSRRNLLSNIVSHVASYSLIIEETLSYASYPAIQFFYHGKIPVFYDYRKPQVNDVSELSNIHCTDSDIANHIFF